MVTIIPTGNADIITRYQGKYIVLVEENGWEYVKRTAEGVIVVVATTNDNELLFVEQYRRPLHSNVIELPAGLVGDEVAGEGTLLAAQRELEEETGYIAAHWEHLLQGPVSPGLSGENIDLYRASELTQVSAGGGVEGEGITVHKVPVDQMHDWLIEQSQRDDCLVDPKVFIGVYFSLIA